MSSSKEKIGAGVVLDLIQLCDEFDRLNTLADGQEADSDETEAFDEPKYEEQFLDGKSCI